MNHPIPILITLLDYLSELTSASGTDFGPICDVPVPVGCERCHAAITSHNAYFARFGTLRCANCIGDDGFTTVADLKLFAQTGTLPCSECGHPVQPSSASPDGSSSAYQCPACGATARFTIATQVTAIYGPGITGSRP
jgi:Zn finger protein HypA/HybF involved in hydrogenase expression